VDGGQVATPAANPAVSPDGSRVLFVWNQQLWMMTLDGQGELTQLTTFEQAVQAGGWSPDGTAIVMTVAEFVGAPLPLKSLVFFRPGDTEVQVLPLTFYPWGPLSWY
jgi:Tol biopolymer transport system component